jgi:Zn-dependent protease
MNPEVLAYAALGLVTLILSVTVHEFAHAFTAVKLGDDLPEREGRVTLNPIAHVDPIGTLLIPAVASITGLWLFGWGRPVMTQPIRYTRKLSMRAGEALVAFAGPFANLVLGVVSTVLLVFLPMMVALPYDSAFLELLANLAQLNFVLFALNLLPFPPLDGSKIAAWIFGYKADKTLEAMANMGVFGLWIVLIVTGSSIAWAAGRAFVALHNLLSG